VSGDQNGKTASSVPANDRAETDSSERCHNRDRPSEVAT
jgi:hypothetical protein